MTTAGAFQAFVASQVSSKPIQSPQDLNFKARGISSLCGIKTNLIYLHPHAWLQAYEFSTVSGTGEVNKGWLQLLVDFCILPKVLKDVRVNDTLSVSIC